MVKETINKAINMEKELPNNSEILSLMVSEILEKEFPKLKNNSLLHDLVLYKVKTIQTEENVLSCMSEIESKETDKKGTNSGDTLLCLT